MIETNLIRSLNDAFEIRSVGISTVDGSQVNRSTLPASPGLPNLLNLVDRPPELWHRWRSLHHLRQSYRQWQTEGWCPDLIMVCNFSPVYNAFIRQIARQAQRPYLVLYMADSTLLDEPLSRGRNRLSPPASVRGNRT